MTAKRLMGLILMAGLGGCSTSEGSTGMTVATRVPTLSSLAPGETALFDDGRCPAGQIAQYHRRAGQARMTRLCIDRPA
ncbi:DUF6719 family protein [Aureimonas sp. Leaf454]|uniref:DUF6719 family protein n=1 Tax=Aureimonas sp. Leaf454 TaxID=1736381 RepID=UPI000A65A359|nr:DUF6719 family protein [Aureimonas sp. Leaf454]